MSPEEYQRSVSEGFHGSAAMVEQLLAIILVLLGIALAIWLLVVRQASVLDLINRMLAWLPVSRRRAGKSGRSQARQPFLWPLSTPIAALSLAHASIPIGVILGYLDMRTPMSRLHFMRHEILVGICNIFPTFNKLLISFVRNGEEVPYG